jgi:hypothetical protein
VDFTKLGVPSQLSVNAVMGYVQWALEASPAGAKEHAITNSLASVCLHAYVSKTTQMCHCLIHSSFTLSDSIAVLIAPILVSAGMNGGLRGEHRFEMLLMTMDEVSRVKTVTSTVEGQVSMLGKGEPVK